jgi:arginase family enzyme
MTSTTDIIKKMQELWTHLEQAGYDCEQLDEDFVIKKIEFEKQYARTFLSESGPMEIRRQQSILDTSDAKFDMELAEVRLRACKERIRRLGQQLEITRSMNAAAQRQFMTEPIGQYT